MRSTGSNPLHRVPNARLSVLQRFAPCLIAIICVGLALLLLLALQPVVGRRFPFIIFLLAVVVSSYLSGPWSAFFATILSSLIATIFFLDPAFRTFPIASADAVGLTVFLIIGLMIAVISGRMSLLERRAKRDADERAQRIVRMADQLQFADRLSLIGTLAAGLTHDIGNLLSPLRWRLDLVEKELKQHDLHSEHVDLLRSIAEHLTSLSRGLSQLVAEPDHLSDTPMRLDEWAGSADRVLRATLPPTVSLSLDIPQGLPPVRIAPEALSQAVFNLVHNAGKAIDGKGHVNVDAEQDAEHNTICIKVRDDGPGMSEDVLSRLHEVKPIAKDGGGIAGLGLKVVHSIITAAGGTVQMSSKKGLGTEVRLTLPAADAHDA